MKSVRVPAMIGLLAAFTAFFFVAGCEDGPNVSEATSYFDKTSLEFNHTDISTYSLSIVWADTLQQKDGLTLDGEVAVLKAGGGTPPYKW